LFIRAVRKVIHLKELEKTLSYEYSGILKQVLEERKKPTTPIEEKSYLTICKL